MPISKDRKARKRRLGEGKGQFGIFMENGWKPINSSEPEKQEDPMERLLTPKEAAAIMSVAPRTIKEWLRQGELTGLKIRSMWRIRAGDLKTFIEKSNLPTAHSKGK